MTVYFATTYHDGGSGDWRFVKIGYSRDAEKRMAELQTGSPIELRVVREVPGDLLTEHLFHKYFESKKHRSEWFNYDTGFHKLFMDFVDFYRFKLSGCSESLACYEIQSWLAAAIGYGPEFKKLKLSGSSTYAYRDAGKRRLYMRDLMRRVRAGKKEPNNEAIPDYMVKDRRRDTEKRRAYMKEYMRKVRSR